MLLILVLCFFFTASTQHHETNVLSIQENSSEPPLIMNTPPLELQETDYSGQNIIQTDSLPMEENSGIRRTYREDCPSAGILLKILNVLTHLLPQDSSSMIEPSKFHNVFLIVKNLLKKSSTMDDNQKTSIVNSLKHLLENINSYNHKKLLRTNEKRYQTKATSFEDSRSHGLECQQVLQILLDFINSSYNQVARYCTLTGKCDANILTKFYHNSPSTNNNSDKQNILLDLLSQKHSNVLDSVPPYISLLPKLDKGNIKKDDNEHKTEQDYLISYLENYQQNKVNNVQDSRYMYQPEKNNQEIKNINSPLNILPDNTNPNYLTGLSPYQITSDVPTENDFNPWTFQRQQTSMNNSSYENFAKVLIDILQRDKSGQNSRVLSRYNDINDISIKNNIPLYYQNYAKEIDAFGDNNSFPKSTYFNDLNKNINKEIPNSNDRHDMINNMPNLVETVENSYGHNMENNANLKTLLYHFIQNNQARTQENNLDKKMVPTKTVLLKETTNYGNQNMPPYVYQKLVNRNAEVQRTDQVSQDSDVLTMPKTVTSQFNNYVSSIMNSFSNNNKHENFRTQLPDSSRLLGVSNLIQLNSVPSNNRILELTYKLKREKAVYEPTYYVKYRISYNEFINNMRNLLKNKPKLRNISDRSYEELLSGSQVIETSGDLKNLNRAELINLTFANGTLVDAKVLENNDLKTNQQLKIIQGLNANLFNSNLINSNESHSKSLSPLEKLLNASITSTNANGLVKNSLNSASDLYRRGSLYGYSNSAYNNPVASNVYYNPYTKTVNPAHSVYLSPASYYGYSSFFKPYNAVNTHSQLVG